MKHNFLNLFFLDIRYNEYEFFIFLNFSFSSGYINEDKMLFRVKSFLILIELLV